MRECRLLDDHFCKDFPRLKMLSSLISEFTHPKELVILLLCHLYIAAEQLVPTNARVICTCSTS